MKRRTFLQSLSALLVPPPRRRQSPQPAYTDSAGRTPADLAPLHDGKTSAAVVYSP